MEAIAKTRHLKGSPRKARLVIDLIRGRNVAHALNILKFTDKRAADPIAKTLRSAIANATYLAEQQNIAIDPDDLFIKTCFVDMGAHKNRRRMRPAPQGRAYREQRHYCHITILVSSDVPVKPESDKPRVKGKKLLAKEAAGASAKTTAKEDKKAKKAQPQSEDEVATPPLETHEAPAVTETVTETAPAEKTAAAETTETAEVAENTDAQAQTENAENDADAADVKDTNTQNPTELNETKRADDKQQDVNEQLERQ